MNSAAPTHDPAAVLAGLASKYAKATPAVLAECHSIIARAVAQFEENGPAGLVAPMRQHMAVIVAEQETRGEVAAA